MFLSHQNLETKGWKELIKRGIRRNGWEIQKGKRKHTSQITTGAAI